MVKNEDVLLRHIHRSLSCVQKFLLGGEVPTASRRIAMEITGRKEESSKTGF